MSSKNLPALLVIMDGYGIAEPSSRNAISEAHTPNLDRYFSSYPTTQLRASGLAVGLPEGQMGNSEVGHLAIGAGSTVYQELTRIDLAIENGSLFTNPVLIDSIDSAVAQNKTVHLMGLVSDGGVHSHMRHLQALIRLALQKGATEVCIHAFLDGRDVAPESGAGFITDLEKTCAKESQLRNTNETSQKNTRGAHIGTVMGRYYAMDRDNRWDRVTQAYNTLVAGEGTVSDNMVASIRDSYAQGVTDEFVKPLVAQGYSPITNGDTVIFFNFRPDRARELTSAFVRKDFDGFVRNTCPEVTFVTLTEYDPTLPVSVAFAKTNPENVLSDVIAQQGFRQLHIAETEKYAHVTFFLNGGREKPNAGEEHILIPSPQVATYDMQPQMSAAIVAETLSEAIDSDLSDFYIVNFANCDMVGHTGSFEAAVTAVEAVDVAVGKVVEAILKKKGFALLTADHGNAEQMVSDDGTTVFTAHTLSLVPLCLVGDDDMLPKLRKSGTLADVAPTLLAYSGLSAPTSWTGESLLVY